jgi:hypothetical protein
MQPLTTLDRLKVTYRAYVDSFQFYRNPAIGRWVQERRDAGKLSWRDPFVTIAKPFAPGTSLADLVDEGLLHEGCLDVFTRMAGNPESKPIEPYKHQEQAVRQLLAGHNTVVSTGTGSGKSFTFYIPIVSHALHDRDRLRSEGRERDFRPPVAIVVYPMNALANSQYEDLVKRLNGTGLRVCNYTGDLKTTYDAALGDLYELTGRSMPEDCEVIDRDTLRTRGVDILLTNFKMLEYALIRQRDAALFTRLGQTGERGGRGRLAFLVLDEMHAYSGRQGADMALLVRRFKQRSGTIGRLRCVGTSATVDTGDCREAATAIAGFASDLFGELFAPEQVITEAYGEKATMGIEHPRLFLAPRPVRPELVASVRELGDDQTLLERLGLALCGTKGAPTIEQVRACKPVAWIEDALWAGVHSLTSLAGQYRAKVRPNADLEVATAEVEAALLLGAAMKMPGPRGDPVGLLSPKVHGFFSQGLPVTGCLRADPLHLSEVGDATCSQCAADGVNGVPAFPMVFCVACGQELFVATNSQRLAWEPRVFTGPADTGLPVYLVPGDSWDEEVAPVDPEYLTKAGQPRSSKAGGIPRRVTLCGACGTAATTCAHEQARRMLEIAEPLLLCPACGIRYDGTHREYNKFFQVGTVGRSTATDVLVGQLLNELEINEQSVMAFTDNQQDSSFQAAHLNGLSRRFHFRRALVAGLLATGATSLEDALSTAEAAEAALAAMESANVVPPFTRQAEAKSLNPDREVRKSKAIYLRYLSAGTLMEASSNWRKAQPTLEDTGLLVVDYESFEDIELVAQKVAEDSRLLAELAPALCVDLLRAVLDQIRRARAVASESGQGPALVFMDGETFEARVVNQLNPNVIFHGGSEVPRRPTVFSDALTSGRAGPNVRRLAGVDPVNDGRAYTTAFTRWLMREAETSREQAKKMVRAAASWLGEYGFLQDERGGLAVAEEKLRYWAQDGRPSGQRCPRCATRHLFVQRGRRCPRCVKIRLADDLPGLNDFFRTEYRHPVGERSQIRAAEHSAAVPGDERKRVEREFRDQVLNAIVCTPTMELGVDIGKLAAVYLRNVPPSPANYAQRQGRAGRAAQPSVVITFCGAQDRNGPHDQYFFRFPEKMIAGRIATPRFLLDNEALVVAHLHSLILGAHGEPSQNIPEWVTLPPNGAGHLTFVERDRWEQFVADRRRELVAAGEEAFAGVVGAGTVPAELVEMAVDNFVDNFEQEWRIFASQLQRLLEEADRLNAQARAGGLNQAEQRRRRAVEHLINDMRNGAGDFYPLAWLAHRGFLPTFAFPRRAVLLHFDDQRNPRVRGRAIALREFAPGAHVYHRGQRYAVRRASLGLHDVARTVHSLTLCPTCGRYDDDEVQTRSDCTCGAPLRPDNRFAKSAIEVPDGFAASQERVSADTEERLRQGYKVEKYFCLPVSGVQSWVARAGAAHFRLTYAHHGEVLQVNTGFRGSAQRGFQLCVRCRLWQPEDGHFTDRPDCGQASESLMSRLVLDVKGTHDMLLVDIGSPDVNDGSAGGLGGQELRDRFGWSLLYALRAGITTRFGIDDSEVDGHVYQHPDGAGAGVRVLLFEADEGGVGVLQRVASEKHWQEICQRAFEVLHVRPDGGEEDGACDSSCYECLRSFNNQWHHENLDRRLCLPVLLAGAQGIHLQEVTGTTGWTVAMAGLASSPASITLVAELQAAGVPAPDAVRPPIADLDGSVVARPSLLYAAGGANVVVFLGDDEVPGGTQRQRLAALGYTVVHIPASDPDDGLVRLRRKLRLSG